MPDNYLKSVEKQFQYYKILGERTFEQIPDEKLFWKYNKTSNDIVVIVKHLYGNMLSRWTDFLTSDGEKEWRNRDDEFINDIKNRKEMLAKWEKGWECLFKSINSLTNQDLNKTIYIRNQGHSVVEAINRQLAHYAYHIGQIVFIGKMICGKNWRSLSIPKGKSSTYNKEKFLKEKHNEHFTDEFIKQKKSNNG